MKIFNSLGMDLIRISRSPKHNLLGLKNLPIHSIIDVGANEGQFAKEISQVFHDAHVYCFEPASEPYEKLRAWSATQNGTVDSYNYALGDTEGTIDMFHHTEHSPSSSILKTTEACEKLYPFTSQQNLIQIKLTTLDNMTLNHLGPIASKILIKLDVQGYEDRVIRGGIETFRKASACILEISLDNLYEKQASFKDIVILLDDIGYRYAGNIQQMYAQDGHVIFIDALFLNRR